MYIIPADSAIGAEQAKVRYLFQYKKSDHLVSLTVDLEEASQTPNYKIDVDHLKERDECTVIDGRPIHVCHMDYDHKSLPWSAAGKQGFIIFNHPRRDTN